MQRSTNLKELPSLFISSGMSLSQLCDYLEVSEELIKEWERFFNLFPETGAHKEKIYSEKRIKDFIKIKDSVEKGSPLHEIRRKIFKIKDEHVTNPIAPPIILPAISPVSPIIEENPFEAVKNIAEMTIKEEDLSTKPDEDSIIKPFLTQINKANERIGELILEKAKIVEETAIEKAALMSQLKTLEVKNTELVAEKETLFITIKEKEDQIKRSMQQEVTLAEALKVSQEMLKQKEEDINNIRTTIDAYKKELQEKDSIIYTQNLEISKLMEKQNRKWWHNIRDLFF